MLTPEYLDFIEFNDVVELYNKLNIEITADIIKKISEMNDIIPTSIDQLKILKQTNGEDIFYKALEETSLLRAETKKALKELFTQMAIEDLEGYKELYEYNDKPFKLNATQYKILNEGLRQTNRTLKNFTKTIAFQSQQAYVETIDLAYMKVATGAFDYATAISQASQELANKGITLKDKLGRNVQLEVAIRRNIMAGIQKTANEINRDIEDELGCNGYEVTAHVGARPTHAEEQGKQFAITKEDAGKYGVGLWSDVAYLWEEYNCRHSYFGIILGVSEPKYTDKELKEMKNATVKYNGKEIPYYEATQKQRALENNIRKASRSAKILEKAGLDSSTQRTQLRQLNKKLNSFLNETGLDKDYSRTKAAVSTTSNGSDTIRQNSKKEEKKLNYLDVTKEYIQNAMPNSNKIIFNNKKFTDNKTGIQYIVDGKHVKFEPSENEKAVAKWIENTLGGKIEINPKISYPQSIEVPDYYYNNIRLDLKEIRGNGKNTIDTAIKSKKEQADNFILDIKDKCHLDNQEIFKQIEKVYNSNNRDWVNMIIVKKKEDLLKIYVRK